MRNNFLNPVHEVKMYQVSDELLTRSDLESAQKIVQESPLNVRQVFFNQLFLAKFLMNYNKRLWTA